MAAPSLSLTHKHSASGNPPEALFACAPCRGATSSASNLPVLCTAPVCPISRARHAPAARNNALRQLHRAPRGVTRFARCTAQEHEHFFPLRGVDTLVLPVQSCLAYGHILVMTEIHRSPSAALRTTTHTAQTPLHRI